MKPSYILIMLQVVVFVQAGKITAQTSAELLVGNWMFDYTTSMNSMESKALQMFNKMDNVGKNLFQTAYQGRKMAFGNNGDFSQQLASGQITQGSWSVNNGSNSVVLTYPNGMQIFYSIVTLTSNSLIMRVESNGKAKMMITEWYFTKI